MFVKNIDWIDKDNLEADVEISDGEYSLVCFSCPFNLQQGDTYNDNIYCLDVEYVYASETNQYAVNRIGDSYNYILRGKVIDLYKKIIQVDKIKIDISNIPIPNDIKEEQYIDIKVTRLDLY